MEKSSTEMEDNTLYQSITVVFKECLCKEEVWITQVEPIVSEEIYSAVFKVRRPAYKAEDAFKRSEQLWPHLLSSF